MLRRFSVNFALASIGVDLVLITISLVIAVNLRPAMSDLPFVKYIPDTPVLPWFIYLLFPVSWVVILLLFSVYDGRTKLSDEFRNLAMGSILACVSLAGALYLSYRDISRLLFLFFVQLAFCMMVFWRIAVYNILKRRRIDTIQRRVLIVGARRIGREVDQQIRNSTYKNYAAIGFLDDDPQKGTVDRKILGTISDAKEIIGSHRVTDVVIALPQHAHQRVNQLVGDLHSLPIRVWIIPDYIHLALHKAVIADLAGLPMLDLRAPALTEYQRMLKRAFDLFITIITAPISLALSILIALAIRLDSEGSIIFKQERVGENSRLFMMYKFRTMQPGAEINHHLVEVYNDEGKLIHKNRDDPRVTKVGKFLRKTSLDEIPQLVNILKGEMSLVGPRPELPYLVNQYDSWQRQRFAVPQGITGWWQINGRSDKPMHLHTEDDLYYVQNYSIFLDLYILMKTVLVVARGEGAF